MSDDSGNDEFTPTPEQAEAYRQRVSAYVGLSLWDKFCAQLPAQSMREHSTQPDCVVVPSVGSSMSVVEHSAGFGIAVPEAHAAWLNVFPFDFIVATQTEIFFISRSFTWLNEEHPKIGISLGPMIPSELLARMCNQEQVMFFVVKDVANPTSGEPLRDGQPVSVFQAREGVPLFQTRSTQEREARAARFDPVDQVRSHFLG